MRGNTSTGIFCSKELRIATEPSIINVFEALGGRIAQKTLGRSEVFGSCLQPERHKHGDADPSLHMSERKGVWTCETCKEGGGIFALVVFAGKARNEKGAAAWLREHRLLAPSQHSNGSLSPARPRAEQRPSRPVDPSLRPSTVPPHAVLVAQYPYTSIDGHQALKTRWEWSAEGQDSPAKSLRWYHLGDDGKQRWNVPEGWKLGLYGDGHVREVAQRGGTVYLCEGEKCVDMLNAALVAAGLVDAVATTVPNKDLLPEHLDAMSGARRIVVLSDADDPGRKCAGEHAAQLRARYEDVCLLDLYESRGDGSDIADFIEEGGTVEQLRDLIKSAPIFEPSAVIVSDPEEDDGDDDALEWPNEKEAPWPTMDPEAFHGLAGELIASIEAETEADQVALLLTLLVAFGSAAGPSSYIIADSARHPAQLYAVLIGGTGTGRKGTSMKVMTRFLKCADEEWFNAVHRSGFLSGEAIIADLAGELDKMPSPYPGQAFVIEPEIAGLLSVNGRDGSTTSPIIRDGWDGGTLSAIRRAERTRVEGAYLCILGHISPEELAEKLTSDQIYNGFANRCLFVCVRRSKKLSSGGHIDQALIGHYGGRLRVAMDFARTGREMKRTPAAEVLWDKLYNEEPDSDGILGAFTARGPAQMLRLSVAFALLDMSEQIDVPHLRAAAAIWRYCRASVSRRIDIDLSPDERKLLDALRGAWPKPMAAREIDKLFSKTRSASERKQAVENLVKRGLATAAKAQTSGAFRKPASLVRALSLLEAGHTGHSATTRVSQHPSARTYSDIREVAVDEFPIADGMSVVSPSMSEETSLENPCNQAMSGMSGKSGPQIKIVSENIPDVSDTKQPGTVPDRLAGLTGTSEMMGEM